MIKADDYIFILRSDDFNEVATIFVSELREAGLWERPVGLTLSRMRGAHG